jgi:CubicO group peptidase (beta-lactamase class C family)
MAPRDAAPLCRYAHSQKSSAVIVVRDGDTLVESYHHVEPDDEVAAMFHGTDGSGQPREDVASIQKSVVALLIGIATTRGEFDPTAPVSSYLGTSWCEAPHSVIHRITVEHLTAMASGLDRDLRLRSSALAEWDYNTRGYTKAREALEAATGRSIRAMTREWLCEPLGLSGTEWIIRTHNPRSPLGLVSTARDLARLGLMVLNGGRTGHRQLIDESILQTILSPSQEQNPSYGHLWWLNGQRFWIGTHGNRHPGPRLPNAPSDTVMAYGKFQRYLWIVPSRRLVAVRMGAEPESDFADRFWSLLNKTIEP